MTNRLNLEELISPESLEKLDIQQKRALAWKLLDERAPSKGFSRKKLVPLHGAIMSILTTPGSSRDLVGDIENLLTESQSSRR